MKNSFLAILCALLISCNGEPEVNFYTSSTTPIINDTIVFTNKSSVNGLYNMMWDFGDGTQSNTFHAIHIYKEVGNYKVTLTGTNKRENKNYKKTTDIEVKASKLQGEYYIDGGHYKAINGCKIEGGDSAEVYLIEGQEYETVRITNKNEIKYFAENGTLKHTSYINNVESTVKLNLVLDAVKRNTAITYNGEFTIEYTKEGVRFSQNELYEGFIQDTLACHSKKEKILLLKSIE